MAEKAAQHLDELIGEAESAGDVEYNQPPGKYVEDAMVEFEEEGYDRNTLPWGAIAMRAHEIREAEERE